MTYPLANRTPRGRTILRRIVIVPLTIVGTVFVLVTLPVTLLIAALVDLVMRRWRFGTVRIVLFVAWYLALATDVQLWGFVLWIRTGFGTRSQTPTAMALQYRTIAFWIRNMTAGLRVLVGVRLEVDNPELAVGPVVIASRHTSLADVFVPTATALVHNGTWVRLVMTSGLVNEPSLDLFGHRSPQYFIQRQATDMSAEVEALKRLAAHTDDNTALVIFPEGGLFRPDRLEKIVASLETKDEAQAAYARRLRHLLPPKVAGFSALLDGAPSADVVIVGHSGYERMTNGATIWRSVPLIEPMRVTLERYPRAEVPDDLESRRAWLNERWAEMDQWIDDQAPSPGRGDSRSVGASE